MRESATSGNQDENVNGGTRQAWINPEPIDVSRSGMIIGPIVGIVHASAQRHCKGDNPN
jgi:hypothetical protein